VLNGEGFVFQQERNDVVSFHQLCYAKDGSKPAPSPILGSGDPHPFRKMYEVRCLLILQGYRHP
jgi:hypothetical protein